MKLSVIIPCYNAEATLGVQLEALSKQEWSEPWELIISNNNSTDNSCKVALQYKDMFHAFKIVDASEKQGGSFAINQGILNASSENVAVCDADDEVMPGWVAAMGNALSKDEHSVVCGKFKFDKFNDGPDMERATKRWENGLFVGNFLPGGGSGNYGTKKALHLDIGGFEEDLPFSYDADYFWRLQLAGHAIHYLKDAGIQIRLGRVNPTFSYMFRRGKNRSASNYWCYRRYKKYGMKNPSSIRENLFQWGKLIKIGLRLYIKNGNGKKEWLPRFASKTGNLVGEIQGRLNNPLSPLELKE